MVAAPLPNGDLRNDGNQLSIGQMMEGKPDSEQMHAGGTSLRELLMQEGDEFIEAAYFALLHRKPDARGGPAYLRALRSGTPKLAILYELHSSDEARRLGAEVPGLTEAFTREGMVDAAALARAAAAIQSAEQLLVIDDPDQFVRMAYPVLLKRPADPQGIAGYKARMCEGISRTQILHELYCSGERQRLGTELPGLREAFRRDGLALADGIDGPGPVEPVRPAQSLAQLLEKQGSEFVECAWLTLFRRRPEAAVLYRQAAKLREGDSKLQLLAELAALPEGAAVVGRVPGLAAALSRHRWARLPLLGGLVRAFGGIEGDAPSERRARASKQRVLALEAALAEQAERFERANLRAEGLARQALDSLRELEARLASLERSDVALRKLMARYMADAPELEPPAQDPHVPASGLALDLRAEEVFRTLRQTEG